MNREFATTQRREPLIIRLVNLMRKPCEANGVSIFPLPSLIPSAHHRRPMSPAFYHIIHVISVVMLASAFGALSTGNEAARKGAMQKHGIALLLLLVSGFGFIAKAKGSYTSPYILVMYAVWLALGVLPVLGKKGILPAAALGKVALLLAAVAAYAGYAKWPGI
jgi:hypothetical protein